MEIKSFKNGNISNIRIYPMAKKALDFKRETLLKEGLPPKSLQDLVNEAIIKAYGKGEVENV